MRVAFSFLVVCVAACSEPQTSDAEQFPAYRIRGRWPRAPRITYYVDDASSPLEAGQLPRAVGAAHELWSTTGVEFVELETAEGADVEYAWRFDVHDSCQAFGRDMSIAHTGPVEPPTFVHFDARGNWDPTDEDGHSLAQAAAHETGHVLGLGHSEDPSSLMYTEAHAANQSLSAEDRAGVASLYGGGTDHEADLVIGDALSLRRIAPPRSTDFAVFDSDGDGDDELFIWNTDRTLASTLMIYHFEPGPQLARSVGPIHGQTVPGNTPRFGVSERGERVLVTVFDDGSYAALRFERRGLLEARADEPLVLLNGPSDTDGDGTIDVQASQPNATSGDLDGDGTPERVTRSARR